MPDPTIFQPTGDLTIFEVAEFRRNLQTRLDGGASLTLNVSAVGKIDASGLQVMIAAHRSDALTIQGLSVATADEFRRLGWHPGKKGIE